MPDESAKPPYGAYPAVRDAIAGWKEHGHPSQIDRSILPGSMSGASQSALLQALKFLGVTDESGIVTDPGKALIGAYGTERWAVELRKLVERAYGPVLGDDFTPKDATPRLLKERLKAAGVGDGQMMDKTCRFYVRAAKDAGIEVGRFLAEIPSSSPRPSRGTPRRSGADGDGEREQDLPPGGDAAVVPEGYSQMPILFAGKQPGLVILPNDLTERDVKVIEAAITYLRAIADAARNG